MTAPGIHIPVDNVMSQPAAPVHGECPQSDGRAGDLVPGLGKPQPGVM